MSKTFEGLGVALVTPFEDSGSVDYKGLGRIVNHVINGGVDYLVVHGTTGEATTLNAEEKSRTLSEIVQINKSRLPVVLGMGGNNTAAIIDQINSTDLTGVDAFLSVVPYYNKPTQKGLIAHFRSIADASPLPIIMYNVPGRTACNLEADSTVQLADHPNIIAIKESSGDLIQCKKIVDEANDNFLVIAGDDFNTLDIMSLGGVGVISVMANAWPGKLRELVDAANSDVVHARQLIEQILGVVELLFEEGNPAGIKESMKLLNLCGSQVRLPLVRATEPLSRKIQSEIKNWA